MDWPVIVIIVLLTIHYFYDTHYFVRSILCFICARFPKAKKHVFLDPSCLYGICTSTDLGLAPDHMNNARFLREFDLGRMNFALRLDNIWKDFFRRGGNCFVTGVLLRYRLPLKIFSPYKVVTKIVWWDGKHVYFDQSIVTALDGITRVSGYIQMATVLNIEEYISQNHPDALANKPAEMPLDMQYWIKSLEENRARLKAENSSKLAMDPNHTAC